MANRISYGRIQGINTLHFAENNTVIEYMVFTNVSNASSIINIYIEEIASGQKTQLCPLNMVISKGEGYTDRLIRVPDRCRVSAQIIAGSFDYYISTLEENAPENITKQR